MALMRQTGESAAERELTRAVRRVHEKYGKNLNAFFEDAKRAAAERVQESAKKESSADGQCSQES